MMRKGRTGTGVYREEAQVESLLTENCTLTKNGKNTSFAVWLPYFSLSLLLTIADTPQLSSTHLVSQQESILKMGLLYSLTAYFSSPHSAPLTEAKIKTSSHKLTIRIRNLQYKLQQEVFKAEQELTAQIRQQTGVRSRQGERVRMDMVIGSSEKRLVYDEVIYCLNRVITQAKQLETAPATISNQCLLAVCSIIHVYEPLGLNQFVRLGQFLPEPLPTIDSSKTRPLLQRYLRKQDITHYQRNLYALELCGRSDLSLAQVNAVGHNFVQDPVQPVQQTPSFQMFAVTLEELAVQEQDKQA